MKTQVVFHNLSKSDALEEMILSRIERMQERFHLPEAAHAIVTVSMDSVQTSGEHFSIKIVMTGKNMSPVIINQSGDNAYQAFALANDRLLEVLHRHIEKKRDQVRHSKRRHKRNAKYAFNWPEAS